MLFDFSVNGEWDLVGSSCVVDTYEEDTHPGKIFPRVTYALYIHRKPLYYFINIVTPCLFCIIIATMVFWLPPESGEKVSLGITVLLSFSVFQLVVADSTPKTSDFTPLLSKYLPMMRVLHSQTLYTICLTQTSSKQCVFLSRHVDVCNHGEGYCVRAQFHSGSLSIPSQHIQAASRMAEEAGIQRTGQTALYE
jgi:hypothetical protein